MKGSIIINNKNCIFYQIDENLNKTIITEFEPEKKVKNYQNGQTIIKFPREELEYKIKYVQKCAKMCKELFNISDVTIEGDLADILKETLKTF